MREARYFIVNFPEIRPIFFGGDFYCGNSEKFFTDKLLLANFISFLDEQTHQDGCSNRLSFPEAVYFLAELWINSPLVKTMVIQYLNEELKLLSLNTLNNIFIKIFQDNSELFSDLRKKRMADYQEHQMSIAILLNMYAEKKKYFSFYGL